MTHLRHELMHAVLKDLLDPEFLHAWRHGMVIKCADGITCRMFPCIFTYSADYPERYVVACSSIHILLTTIYRVLLATIRDKGGCPCPQCLVPMKSVDKMGTHADMCARTESLRRNNQWWQQLIQRAQSMIYEDRKAVSAKEVEALLRPKSMVPTQVMHKFGFHQLSST
jgi:Zn-finger nucleic acid-binding protein